jgi:hypothetical protein
MFDSFARQHILLLSKVPTKAAQTLSGMAFITESSPRTQQDFKRRLSEEFINRAALSKQLASDFRKP